MNCYMRVFYYELSLYSDTIYQKKCVPPYKRKKELRRTVLPVRNQIWRVLVLYHVLLLLCFPAAPTRVSTDRDLVMELSRV